MERSIRSKKENLLALGAYIDVGHYGDGISAQYLDIYKPRGLEAPKFYLAFLEDPALICPNPG